jgi:tRNA pseudouridine synthase 10
LILTDKLSNKNQSQLRFTPLCNVCLLRQFPNLLSGSNKQFNQKQIQVIDSNCFICKGIMTSIHKSMDIVCSSLSEYQFETFVIGTRIDSSIIEREDEIRSKLKLKGGENIKQNFNRLLSSAVSQKLGKSVNFRDPDIELILNIHDNGIEVRSKSLFAFGRYTKLKRGISQKTSNYNEFNLISIENILSKKIIELSQANYINFTWIGGEDNNSLVSGEGRPFYSEIVNPKNRKLDPKDFLNLDNDFVILNSFEFLDSKPLTIPSFTVEVKAHIKISPIPSKNSIKKLEDFYNDREVTCVNRKGNRNNLKKVYSLSVEKIYKSKIVANIHCDGGLTIRNLVEGGGYVSPSISDILSGNIKIDKKVPFDIINVSLNCS